MALESLRQNQIPEPESDLWSFQENGLAAIEAARLSGSQGGYLNWATGLGKSVVAAYSVKKYLDENPDNKALVLAHRGFILQHLSEVFGSVTGIQRRGHIFGQEYEDRGRVVFASFQAMNRKLGGGRVFEAFDPDEFGYGVVDEFHHGPAPTYRQVIDYFQPSFWLGLTAIPERRDNQDISKIFGPELDSILLEQAIAKGWLTRPEYHVLTDRVRDLDVSDLEGRSLDYINKMLFVPKRDEEIASTINEYRERLRREIGREPRMIVFCPSIPHTEYFASLISGNLETLHSQQKTLERDKNWEDFRSGKINGLLAVDMLNEGIDVPDLDMAVFLRATQSRAIFLQQVGRGLRRYPGKDKVVYLDFVASWERLHTLKSLEDGIRRQSYKQRKSYGTRLPEFVDTAAEFHYSVEAVQAIATINYARGAKRHKRTPKETPRLDEWAFEEGEVKNILHLSHLPNQRITGRDWVNYAERLNKGEESVKLEIFQRYLRTAYSTARTYAKSNPSPELTVDDLFQAAMIGVYEGINKYDPIQNNDLRKNIGFSIFKALTVAQRQRGIIQLPVRHYEFIAKFEKGRLELQKKLGEQIVADMTFKEIAVNIGLETETADEHEQLRRLAYEQVLDVVGLDNHPSSEKTPFQLAKEQLDHDNLNRLLQNLSYRERRVLELRYGLGGEHQHSLNEIGHRFNVQRERVRQIENQAVKKLQNFPDAQTIRPEDYEGVKELTPNTLQIRKARLRQRLNQAGATLLQFNKGPYKQIAEVDPILAGMAYDMREILTYEYARSPNRLWSPGRETAQIDKDHLYNAVISQISLEDASYSDFIRTLRAMEKAGLLSCQYNERGSVIKAVEISIDQLRRGQLQPVK